MKKMRLLVMMIATCGFLAFSTNVKAEEITPVVKETTSVQETTRVTSTTKAEVKKIVPKKVKGLKIKRSADNNKKKDCTLLEWNKQDGVSYKIYRKYGKKKYKKVATVKNSYWAGVKYGKIQYVDTGLKRGRKYKYKVVAYYGKKKAKGSTKTVKKWKYTNAYADYCVLKKCNKERKKKGLRPYYWDFKMDKGTKARAKSKWRGCHYIKSYKSSGATNSAFNCNPDFTGKYVDLFVDCFDYYQKKYCKSCGGDGTRAMAVGEILASYSGIDAYNAYVRGHYKSHGYMFFLTGTEDGLYNSSNKRVCMGHKGAYDNNHTVSAAHPESKNNPGGVYGMSSWSFALKEGKDIESQGDNITTFSIMKICAEFND